MQAFVGNLIQRKPRRALSPEFKHALAREILKTERLRVIALIITATVLAAALTTLDVVAPAILDRVWQGHFPILYVWAGLGGFILFEAWVLALISRQLKRDLDVPQVRRYVDAFIETSLPSLLLVAHMSNMGAAPALGFVAPLFYFVFIILSTLVSISGFRLSPVSWQPPSCSPSRCFIPPHEQPSATRC
jgi:adenylate cyclase